MSRRLLILGAGGHGRAVADLAAEAGWTVAGFTDRGSRVQVLGTDREIGALARAGTIDAGVVGVGNSAMQQRAELWALLRSEFDVLRQLRHPGLVRVFDFGEVSSAGVVWFTSELVPGPDEVRRGSPPVRAHATRRSSKRRHRAPSVASLARSS